MGIGYHYRARYELILFWEKGSCQLFSRAEPNVQRAKSVRRGYPTEKPRRLIETLFQQSVPRELLESRQISIDPSEFLPVVFDPFCGSGVVGEVAARTECKFIGFDSSTEVIELTRGRRLKAELSSALEGKNGL